MSASELRGQRLFNSTCSTCHHADSNQPLSGPGLKGILKKQYLPSGAPANDERVHDTILNGRRSMPAYGQVFDDSQIRDVIAYLHTL